MDYDRDVPRISEFFRGREVFITGGTGSVGKALIEKILYSCPEVEKIYMLLRQKRGLHIHERLTKFTSNMIFNRIREKDCTLLKKLVPISGDCKELNLGLSNEDKELMKNVSVVFHGAASIRFDDPLKDAILLNTRGTREVISFAETLKKLCVFVHISTTYCNPLLLHVEEKLYPMKVDWRESIRIAENIDRESFDILAPFYMDFYPNSYTFTKGLSEQIINEYKDKLPVVIFRPSIVTPSLREPYPGWLDFISGPIAYTLPGSFGINHVGLFNKKTACDYIPLDIVIKSLIITCYAHGIDYEKHKQLPELEIYNCAAGPTKLMTVGDLLEYSRKVVVHWPVNQAIWSSRIIITESIFIFKILSLLLQYLPGQILDLVAALFRKKQRILPILRTISYATCKLRFFLFNTWNFDNSKYFSLMKYVKDEDHEEFYFNYYSDYTPLEYIFLCGIGSRRYLLKQGDESLNYAKIRYRIIIIADYMSVILFSVMMYHWFLSKYFEQFYTYWWK